MLQRTSSLVEIARVFGTVGSITFGGESATIAALEREILEYRRWLGWDRFALCENCTIRLGAKEGTARISEGWSG